MLLTFSASPYSAKDIALSKCVYSSLIKSIETFYSSIISSNLFSVYSITFSSNSEFSVFYSSYSNYGSPYSTDKPLRVS